MLTACKQYSLAIPKAFGTTQGNAGAVSQDELYKQHHENNNN